MGLAWLSALALAMACDSSGPGKSGGDGGTGGDASDLAVTRIDAPSAIATGAPFDLVVDVKNVGTERHTYTVLFVLSPDAAISGDDVAVAKPMSGALDPGETATLTRSVTLPANVASGAYFVGGYARPITDAGAPETNVANNGKGAAIAITGADCVDDSREADDTQAMARHVDVGSDVRGNFCRDRVDWIAFDATAGEGYVVTNYYGQRVIDWSIVDAAGTLLVDQSTVDRDPLTGAPLPWVAPATATYFVKLASGLAEVSEIGPASDYTIAITPPRGNLTLWRLMTTPSIATTPGGLVDVQADIRTSDPSFAPVVAADVVFSVDPVLDAGDRVVFRTDDATSGGTNSFPTWHFTLPADVPVGTGYLFTRLDPDDAFPETLEIDNLQSPPATLTVTALACTPDAFEEDDFVSTARPFPVGATGMMNFCDDAVDLRTFDLAAGDYLFARVEAADEFAGQASMGVLLDLRSASGATVGSSGDRYATANITVTGTYVLRARPQSATSGRYDPTGTNAAYRLVRFAANTPDIEVTSVAWPSTWATGQIAKVTVTNVGASTAMTLVGIYLSSDATITTQDTQIGSRDIGQVDAYPVTRRKTTDVTLTIPSGLASGTYYIGVLLTSSSNPLNMLDPNPANDVSPVVTYVR